MNIQRAQRFQAICAAGDKIVKETGLSPSEVSGYAVSMAAFSKKPNGDFYALFGEWQKQRGAAPGAPLVGMPPEAEAALEKWADEITGQLNVNIKQNVKSMAHSIAGSYDQTISIRVNALEHMCSDLLRQKHEVIETLKETDVELEEAKALIASLTKKLDEASDQIQRLLGRLEERDLLLKMLMPDANALVPLSTPGGETAEDDEDGDADGPADGESNSDLKAVSEGQPVGLSDQVDLPTTIKAGHSTDGQVEMPFGTNDDADKTDVARGDDDNS